MPESIKQITQTEPTKTQAIDPMQPLREKLIKGEITLEQAMSEFASNLIAGIECKGDYIQMGKSMRKITPAQPCNVNGHMARIWIFADKAKLDLKGAPYQAKSRNGQPKTSTKRR